MAPETSIFTTVAHTFFFAVQWPQEAEQCGLNHRFKSCGWEELDSALHHLLLLGKLLGPSKPRTTIVVPGTAPGVLCVHHRMLKYHPGFCLLCVAALCPHCDNEKALGRVTCPLEAEPSKKDSQLGP